MPSSCNDGGYRTITVTGGGALDVVCFTECQACQGCADPFAANFDPVASPSSPSSLCVGLAEAGCTYPDGSNYSSAAVWDDGTCTFDLALSDCPDNNGDGLVGVNDVLILLAAFGDTCE